MNKKKNAQEILWNDFDEKVINSITSFVDGKYTVTKENGFILYITSIAITQFILKHEEYLPIKFTDNFTDNLAYEFSEKAEEILEELKKLGTPIFIAI
ncbi:MAG: hypothetical protein M1480_17555 [Bacteroidetes bacterium]|nr:hypothetical protein [Bacteroidota bacterium]